MASVCFKSQCMGIFSGFEGLAPLGYDSRLADHGPQTGGAWHRKHLLKSKCLVDIDCYEKLYHRKKVRIFKENSIH